jgi:AcrR family transcriptional regulator
MKRRNQIRESKRMIARALVRLVQHTDFDNLSVSQITAEANVSRNTYYRNFESKDDIVRFLFRTFLENVRERINELDSFTIRDFLVWRFQILRERPEFTVFLSNARFARILRDFQHDSIDTFELPLRPIDRFTREFYLGGLDYVTAQWIRSGMKESPDEIADRVYALVRGNPTEPT